MNLTVLVLAVSAVLVVVGAVLRELDVPDAGAVGRSVPARVLTVALVITTVAAAVLTLDRLLEMSL